ESRPSGGRRTGRRRPESGSLRKRVLFHTQTPAYFSLRRITRTVETAHPRRAGPRLAALAGKGGGRGGRGRAACGLLGSPVVSGGRLGSRRGAPRRSSHGRRIPRALGGSCRGDRRGTA